MHRILVVEDEPALRHVVRLMLEAEGYRVSEAADADHALRLARGDKPDLVLLDLGLPDADGLAVIRRVRTWSPVPIVVLSARSLEAQKVEALDAGADDYVTKPFGAPELLARVRAALRRHASGGEQVEVVRMGATAVDLSTRLATGPAGEIHLTPIEYRVLSCLARGAGGIVPQAQLIREVWGPDRDDDTRNLRVAVRGLRQKLEPDPRQPRYLLTETGVGYRLRLD